MKKEIFGRNVKPGMKPGGFSTPVGVSRARRARKVDANDVCEAANRVLEKRGELNQPNAFDRTVLIQKP